MMDGIFEEGDIVRFTDHSRYRGAIGTVKGIFSDYDGIEYYVLIEGDEDNEGNYHIIDDYDIGWVSPEKLEPDKLELPYRPAFQTGDVVGTPDGIGAVREVIIVSAGKTAEYIYETSPLDSDDKVSSYGESSLEFLYHDAAWEEYFTKFPLYSLPEWRGELYNFKAFDYYWRENTVSESDYQNDTLPPNIMAYILEEYTAGGRIKAVLAPKKNRREIEKILNLKPKQLDDIKWSIIDKIDNRNISEIDPDFKKEVSNRSKFRFTELELSVASEISRRDVSLGQPRNHFPVDMTGSQIMRSVMEAYNAARKISKRQLRSSYITKHVLGNKAEPVKGSILYEGISKNGLTIRFWYNYDLNLIENAYPVIKNNDDTKI